MAKFIITKEHLKGSKLLKKKGFKEGDEIEIPDDVVVQFGPGSIPSDPGPKKPPQT